jgi:CHAD domain-containing protein
MAKNMLAELQATPPKSRGTTCWYDRLPKASRKQVDNIEAAFHAGKLPHSKNEIAEWLVERLKLNVNAASVVKHIDGAKPDGTRR